MKRCSTSADNVGQLSRIDIYLSEMRVGPRAKVGRWRAGLSRKTAPSARNERTANEAADWRINALPNTSKGIETAR